MDQEKKNMLMFFAISMFILLGYPYIFNNHQNIQQCPIASIVQITTVPTQTIKERPAQTSSIEIVKINTKNLEGYISSEGVNISNVNLKNYKESIDTTLNVEVLNRTNKNYFASTSWKSNNPETILPDENSHWEVSSTNLSENSPVIFKWNNDNGLSFEKHISIDDKYVISIIDKVKNYGKETVQLTAISKINKGFKEENSNFTTAYEGPLGYINDKLEEISYEDIAKKNEIKHKTQGGWFGITEKYWLVAFIPNQFIDNEITYRHVTNGKNISYEVETSSNEIILTANNETSISNKLFVGAKELKVLDEYEEKFSIKHFDLAIDFGMLYILTKPLLYVIAYMKDLVGNMGLGIILITILVKLLLLPLANKSYRAMNRMKNIQPKITELQKKYANDKVKLGQAVAETYKKEGVNPISGCLPTLLQSPILFALYKVLYISIEMRQAPFMLWIHDLSMPDPMTLLNFFGMIPIDLPSFLQIGILPILMGLSMFWQQSMTPAPSDPTQAKMMLIMPIMFTFMFAQLPSGLVLYWTISNILGIFQQLLIIKLDQRSKNIN